ncbi:MAG: glycosyltransferase [Bdellovibrio sp.]|nr:MAG: glycosyltransferase [Bdellovibrio sp.]
MNSQKTILYISYDGLQEPLGQSQVYSYIKELSKSYRIILLSFEKQQDSNYDHWKTILSQHHILWHPLPYHKTPSLLATAYDVFQGLRMARSIKKKHKTSLTHARSYVATFIAWLLFKQKKQPFIFDMRGFWADEKVEGGSWKPSSIIYKITKWLERKFISDSSKIISLTKTAKREIQKKFSIPPEKISVIPTCTDLKKFKPLNKKKPSPFLIGYVGATQLWYRFEPVAWFFKAFQKHHPDALLKIFNKGEHEYIQKVLKKYQITHFSLQYSSHSKIAQNIQNLHLGVFFIYPSYSKKASTPTKLGEFLACGVPCFTNSGVGDVDEILQDNKVGCVVKNMEPSEIEKKIPDLLNLLKDPELPQRCRKVAEEIFSLEKGVQKYKQVYRSLVGQ